MYFHLDLGICYESCTLPFLNIGHKGQYIKYVGDGPEGFCGGHEIF